MNRSKTSKETQEVSAILRVTSDLVDVYEAIECLLQQLRQVIVVKDISTDLDLSQKTLQEKFIDKNVVSIEISSSIGEEAFSIGASLAKYRICILWTTDLLIPDGLIDRLLEVYHENKLLGISGCASEDMTEYFLGLKDSLCQQTKPINYLESCGLMLDRKFLQLYNIPFSNPKNRQAMLWVQANAQRRLNAELELLPITIDRPIQKLDSTMLNQLKVETSLACSNENFSFDNYQNWEEINLSILPKVPKGSHFHKLPSSKYKNLLVFGSQRTGTTWVAKSLGRYLPKTFSFTEKQTFYFLLQDYSLPNIDADVLVFQTTFINNEIESYENSSKNTQLLLMARNPFSVVCSLLYNFGFVNPVYMYNKTRMQDYDFVNHEENNLKKAIEIYRQSMRVSLNMIKKFDRSKIKVVFYNDMVLNTQEVLVDIAKFLNIDCSSVLKTNFQKTTHYLSKWNQLNEMQINFIKDYAVPIWQNFLEEARERGIRYADVELSKLSSLLCQ